MVRMVKGHMSKGGTGIRGGSEQPEKEHLDRKFCHGYLLEEVPKGNEVSDCKSINL